MHPCRSWILVGVCASWLVPFAAQSLVVYKWTDAQGVVHFSDQPVPGAEKVFTSSAPEHAGILGQTTASPVVAQAKPKTDKTLSSARIAIASPAPEQTFTGGETVPVSLSVDGDLKSSWTVVWTLNGAVVQGQSPTATSFTLTDLARGVYTIEATVSDAATGESKTADAVTFNVLRPSLLSPQHK
jgi:Domain of unknown function (DUF4124)